MTKLKRLVAVALAVLMILGNFSMAASALDVRSFDGNTLTISTKIFREVNGEWVETEKVKQGETVKARVFLGTDYYTSSGSLLFFYDSTFFDEAYGTSKEVLIINPYYTSSPYVATGDFYAPGSIPATNIEKHMLNNNKLSGIVSDSDTGTAFSTEYDAFVVSYEFGPTTRNQKLNGSKWFCEFTFTVKEDAADMGDFLAVEKTTSSHSFTSGYINVPKGTYDGYNENVVDMASWDAILDYTSQPVSLYINPVVATFNAGDGAEFANGDTKKIYEGEAGEALEVEIPEKDNYEFLGWKIVGTDEASATITAYPAQDTEYTAVYAPLNDVDETLSFRTEIHRLNPETGEYEKTEKVKHGETVKARLYIDTTYFTNTGDILVFYDNDFFTDAYANDVPINLVVNDEAGTSAADLGINGTFAKATNANNEIINRLITNGYLTSDFVSTHTAFAIQYRFDEKVGGSKLEGEAAEDWFVEFDLQVLNTAEDWGDFFIVEETIENPNEGYYAHINVPLSTEGGSATDAIPMYLWEVNAEVESNPVTVESTITLDANTGTFAENGSDTYVIDGYAGGEVAAPEKPSKEGYTFMGWVDEDGNEAEIPAEMPFEDITLTAVWKAEVEITFVLNNGAEDIVVTVTSGEPFEAPEEPTKTGSRFEGWTDDPAATLAKALPEVYPDVDTTYYAVYETYDYFIYYYVLNPNNPKFELRATETAEYGAVIPATPAMYTAPEGYSLSEAYTDVALSVKLADGATMPASKLDLYYKLIPNTYFAEFNAVNGELAGAWADGETVKKVATKYEAPIAMPEDPILEGYNFIGWDEPVGIMDTTGKIFTAIWEPATYTATFIVEGEVYDAFETVYGEAIDIPPEPHKEGHNFTGWEPKIDETMPARDTEYVATFAPDKFYATFDANGGGWTTVDENGDIVVDENGKPVLDTADKVVETTFGIKIKAPADPEKEGYVFGGWDPLPGEMPAKDTTYTAIWNPDENTPYKVEIHTMDTKGEYVCKVQNKTGTTGTMAEISASAAEGFYIADESVLSAEILPDGSTVLKVYYARNEYTITFYSMGGKFEDDSTEDTAKYYHGASVTAPVPTRTGYTFAGWDKTVVPMALGNAVYNATWTANQYTITFDTVGGTEIKPLELSYNKTVELPENPEKLGYIFEGWTWTMTNEAGETVVIEEPEKMPAYNVNAQANWTPDTFDATFDANGGDFDGETTVKVPTVFDTDIVVPGEEGSAYDEPTREGYDFDGWVDENGNPPADMDDKGKNFTAVWLPADMTVPVEIYLMDVDGTYPDTPDETSSVASKTEATASVVPAEKDNYTVDEENSVLEAVVEADGSTVLKIYYALDKATISFVVDSTVTEVEGFIGATVPADKVPDTEKDGYTFAGWEDADGNVSENAPATFPEENKTITAVWTPKQYKLTYISDVIENADGTTTNVIVEGFNEKLVDCGASVPAPEMPTKVGYTFGGWFDDSGVQNTEYKTMPAKDLVFTAKWNSIDGVPYTFVVYEMDVEGEYPDEPTSTTTLTDGEVGKNVTVGYTAPKGFTLADNKLSGTIVAGEDLVLYAYIARNKHNFTAYFDTEKSSIVAQYDHLLYGAPIPAVADPVNPGFAFTGWVYEDGSKATIPALMGDEDIVVYATWKENAFDATFDAGDGYFVDDNGDPIYDENGDKVSTETNPTTFGDDIKAPSNDPVKDGYEFVGWAPADDPENVITDGDYGKMDDDGVDFVAVWKEATYKLTFYKYVAAEGGSAAPTVTDLHASTNVKFGDPIVAPPAPEFEGHYNFLGWVDNPAIPPVIDADDAEAFGVITNEELETMTMPAGDYNLYAVYERIPVKLVPVEGSTTMVDRDGVIESYNDGYTVTPDPYDTPDSYDEWYIYGLRTRLKEKTLLSKYITVLGDGRIEVERVTNASGTTYGSVGTGAIVKVFDNVTGEQVEQFYIIIYGDVNGDADANAGDAAVIYDETINVTEWSIKNSEQYRAYKVKAGNVVKDRDIDTMDGLVIEDYAVGVCDIDQITCTVIPL